jgi:urea transport system permease protein
MGGLFIAVVLAFPRGLAGLFTDQVMPFVRRLGSPRGSMRPSAAPAE